jgi:hypothetical protein
MTIAIALGAVAQAVEAFKSSKLKSVGSSDVEVYWA